MKKVEQVSLLEPLTIGGKSWTTVDVRRPTVGDEEDAMDMAIKLGRGENRVTLELCLMSRLTSIPYDALRRMEAADYTAIRDAANSISARPTTPTEGDAKPGKAQKSDSTN